MATASVKIQQLKDDLCEFYPISCVQAVQGGISNATKVTERDFTPYLKSEFKINGNMFKLNEIDEHLRYWEVFIDTNGQALGNGDNVLSNSIPLTYAPEYPIVLKTLTNSHARCSLFVDGDGILHCNVVSNMTYERTPDNTGMIETPILDVTEMSGITMHIK